MSSTGVTTDQIKELRRMTGVSVMQCKKALEEAEGDMEKAKIILQKLSSKAASKKSDRTLGAGTIATYLHPGGNVGVLVELQCETDFVSKNEEFLILARDIAMQVAATNPEYVNSDEINEESKQKAVEVFQKDAEGKPEDIAKKIIEGKLASYFKEKTLLDQDYIKDTDKTISEVVEEAVQKFGEKIQIARISRFGVLE
jgi:elongation factor Ts